MNRQKKPLIIVLVGPIGSGKSTVSGYLCSKYKATLVKFSAPLARIVSELGTQPIHENLTKLTIELINIFGYGVYRLYTEQEIQRKGSNLVVVDGVRFVEMLDELKKLGRVLTVFIDALAYTRFRRVRNRGEQPEEYCFTWDEFVELNNLETERHTEELRKASDHTIINDGVV